MIELNAEARDSARMLAQGVASTLKGAEKMAAEEQSAEIVEALREICESDASACQVARAISRMFATVATTTVQRVAELLDQNIIIYGMAAGHLAGEYPLPAAAPAASPDRSEALAEQIGQHL